MGDIRLFVSHAHTDKKIAVALVAVVEAAMVRNARILCTSHDKPEYREPEGVDVSKDLRIHLTDSPCVLAVLTPNSVKSAWCLFELGGAWALASRTYPLLAGGLSREDLPAALAGKDAAQPDPAQLTEPEEIRRVLKDLRENLKWQKRNTGSAEKEINYLVEVVRGCTWP
jgi:hypothetical protein